MDFQIFANNLRHLVNLSGKTTTQVAKELHMSFPSLSRYMNGQRVPDINYLLRIADYFNVSLDWLVGRKERSDQIKITPELIMLSDLYQKATSADKSVIQLILKKYRAEESQDESDQNKGEYPRK